VEKRHEKEKEEVDLKHKEENEGYFDD